jgi:hypothetical protein
VFPLQLTTLRGELELRFIPVHWMVPYVMVMLRRGEVRVYGKVVVSL